MHSQTSLNQTRIIRTYAYIEVALWSRPPAIVTGGKMHRIYQTWLYQILGYIEYAVLPYTSTASFISKSINTSDSGRPASGQLVKCDTTHRQQCQAIFFLSLSSVCLYIFIIVCIFLRIKMITDPPL